MVTSTRDRTTTCQDCSLLLILGLEAKTTRFFILARPGAGCLLTGTTSAFHRERGQEGEGRLCPSRAAETLEFTFVHFQGLTTQSGVSRDSFDGVVLQSFRSCLKSKMFLRLFPQEARFPPKLQFLAYKMRILFRQC